MSKFLLVEDQASAASAIARRLGNDGFAVDVARTGPRGLHVLLTRKYTVAILDVKPGIDARAIVQAARGAGNRTPALILATPEDIRGRALSHDIDGVRYLLKPFGYSELVETIRVILRHRGLAGGAESSTLELGSLRIELIGRRAFRGKDRLDLAPRQFTLLTVLARRAGQVLTRTMLAEEVWDMAFDSDTKMIDVAIRRLRSKLDDSYAEKLLRTVRGQGYVLVPDDFLVSSRTRLPPPAPSSPRASLGSRSR